MNKEKVGIIGLGYVGLPLAVAFARHYQVTGFDIDSQRVEELKLGFDRTHELTKEAISSVSSLLFTDQQADISNCTIYIVTVPTPLNPDKTPDLRFLINASSMIGRVLKKNDLVIYESTVYPGCTEEECVPVLEEFSSLQYNRDFFVGYSPERINPGDQTRKIEDIKKIVSGSTAATAIRVQQLYDAVITAGTYLAPSIKVAEAAKAIENAQRDVNISFMNELALMFDKMGIDTGDVLEAAATKWNFLPFRPGLVGGHCIGVDPHYLVHKARAVGYEPRLIAAGREINDQMGVFVAEKMIAALAKKKNGNIKGARVLILGFSFKENCSDTRNTKVIDIYQTLKKAGVNVFVQDPWVDHLNYLDVQFVEKTNDHQWDAVLLAIKHDMFKKADFEELKNKGALIFDTQGIIEKRFVDWRL
ncbi:nucleotide sugar dehydrogenase [Sediminibacterium sp.]|uniref:nucleotide sugar dehydrogenase n=1 Tax=Sediminibacterium sp. TaxID=1917865 RepID=UPI0025FC75AB|nr:nucleotide sugar dehydrogenase [Sediminibacterium sp.]